METLTFNDWALLIIATSAVSMTVGGLLYWIAYAIMDIRNDD